MGIHDSPAYPGCSALFDFYPTLQAMVPPEFRGVDERKDTSPCLVGVTGQSCSLNFDDSFAFPELTEQDRPSSQLDLPGGVNKLSTFLPKDPPTLIHRSWLDIGYPGGFKQAQLENQS